MSDRDVNALHEVRAILAEAFGKDLSGSERGPLVSSHYLARIRNCLRGDLPLRARVCEDCIDLRLRLVNIYHLTLTGPDAASTVRHIRAASGPGAPAPNVAATARAYTGTETTHGRCGFDCLACAAGAPAGEDVE